MSEDAVADVFGTMVPMSGDTKEPLGARDPRVDDEIRYLFDALGD